jgi:phospholipid/cholesterol/gamma-HCH transport system substrate-binding protein/paraquat-inducible protein B
MEESKRYFRLGLFVFVALLVAAAILFILGGRSLFQPSFTFETYFNQSVAGLTVGAPVQFRGVPLGQVTQIITSGAEYERERPFDQRLVYIVVRAKVNASKEQVHELEDDIDDLIKRGLRAQTQLAGITGQQYLTLNFFDPEKSPSLKFDWKPKYTYVPSVPSFTSEIIANAQQFLASLNEADIKELGQNLNKLVVALDRKVEQLPVAELSTEASAALKDAHVAINRLNAILARPGIDVAIHNIASASGRLDGLLADKAVKQTVDNTAVFTDRLRKLAESGDLDRMVTSIEEMAQRIDALVADNQYDVRVIVQDLRATAGNLRTLSETLKRYPAGALIGGPPNKLQLPGKSP